MTNKRRAIYAGVIGCLTLCGSLAAFVGIQACHVQDYWLHAMVFPINARTLAYPTSLTYFGRICELGFPVLLLLSFALLATSARFAWLHRSATGLPHKRPLL